MKLFWASLMFFNLVFGLHDMFWGLVAFYAEDNSRANTFAFAVLFHLIAYHFCSVAHEKELEKETDDDYDEM